MIIVCAVLLVLVVLVQNSKGGGLASGFGQGNQVMGVKKTADFLEKATWTIAALIMILSLTTAIKVQNDYKKLRPSKTEQTEQTDQSGDQGQDNQTEDKE